MNNRAVFAKFLELARHAVIEAHAKSEQQVRAAGIPERSFNFGVPRMTCAEIAMALLLIAWSISLLAKKLGLRDG